MIPGLVKEKYKISLEDLMVFKGKKCSERGGDRKQYEKAPMTNLDKSEQKDEQ